MTYRKFKANQLFTGYELLDDRYVLITDEEGIVENILPAQEAGDDIQQLEGILSPGLINCHCHLELSHMKGIIPENTGMIDFILTVVQQRHIPEEIIYDAIEKAEMEMIQNGIVAVGDICNNTLTLAQKSKGHLYYHNFIEASGFPPAIADQRFQRSVAFFNDYARQYAVPIESNSIVPHAPYSVSPILLERIVDFPGNHILTMHNQECKAEEELFVKKQGDFLRLYEQMNINISFFQAQGKNSLQTVLPFFKKNQTLISVHNVTTSINDIKSIGNSVFSPYHFYFCLCPNANKYIGNDLPDVLLLMNSGYSIVIGTDSLASNHQLSILAELKTLQQHFQQLTLQQLLQWATLNGAKALQLDQILGSFENGKEPGVILIQQDLSKCEKIL